MGRAGGQRVKRPFWTHQLVEYVLGGVLVAQGLQSPTPAVPAVAGGLLMANAAIVRGPLSAFRWVGRTTHRALDIVVVAVLVALAAQPVWSVESTTRALLAVVGGLLAFVTWQTNFAERRRTRPPIDAAEGRGTEIGRLAGRAVGDGINAVRRLRRR